MFQEKSLQGECKYSVLQKPVKGLLCLAHGNADVERSLSANIALEHMAAGRFSRSLAFFLLLLIVANEFPQLASKCTRKCDGFNLVHLQVGRNCSSVTINSSMFQLTRKPSKSDAISTRMKVMAGIHIVNYTLAASLVLLANDVSLNPGPTNRTPNRRTSEEIDSSFSNSSFMSEASELSHSSTTGSLDDSFASTDSVLTIML